LPSFSHRSRRVRPESDEQLRSVGKGFVVRPRPQEQDSLPSPPLFQREQASQTRGPSSGLCSAGALMRSFDNSSPAASTTWHVVWERRGGRPALKERFGTSSRMIGKFRTISRQTMVGGPKENPDKIILLLLQPPCCVCVS
jgi:hypothetical protein